MSRAKRILLLAVAGVLALSGCSWTTALTALGTPDTGGGPLWDAGNIISDATFFNMGFYADPSAVQRDLDKIGGDCTAATCLRLDTWDTPSVSSDWCSPYSGASAEKYATILYKLSKACGINPQVVMIMIQKESQGLTRALPPSALTGFGCPDSGPGGSANCSASSAGVWNQTYGMFQAFAHAKKEDKVVQRYIEGPTPHDIFWNVEETGCGAGPVTVKNRATAILYTYTPYQPNAASLAAYPGTGDACSSYGNRNFFEMFKKYFGTTGGGTGGSGTGGNTVLANGVNVTIPNNQFVTEVLRGKTIQAPTAGIAKGLAAGFSKLGMPYVWGGGGSGADANDGCARGGGSLNSCQGIIGFDCSGLTAYVLVQAGYGDPGGESGTQRATGQDVSWDQGLPADIVGFQGHVAIYLGSIDGQRYILEASTPGVPIHIVKLTRTDFDSSLHRHWTPGV